MNTCNPLTIYNHYPRKVGRRKALLEIERAIKRLRTPEEGPMREEDAVKGLLLATCKFAQSPAGQRGGFTPHPSTWYHQSRYLDDPLEWNNVPETQTFAALNESATDTAIRRVRENRQRLGSDGNQGQPRLDRKDDRDVAQRPLYLPDRGD